jgi:integration host factor subunit beta
MVINMNKKVTKIDLVESIYKETDCERQDIQTVVDQLLVHLKKSLEQGATIELRGFGTFEPRLRKGRACARNPKTGETLSVEPHYIAAFRAGQSLKENLWNLDPAMTRK